jgi:hypothetical protein
MSYRNLVLSAILCSTLSTCTSDFTYEELDPILDSNVALADPEIQAAYHRFQEVSSAFFASPASTEGYGIRHVAQLNPIWEEASKMLFFGDDQVVIVPFAVPNDTITSADGNIYLAFSNTSSESTGVSIIGIHGTHSLIDRLDDKFNGYVYTMDENLVVNRAVQIVDNLAERVVFDPSGTTYFSALNQHLFHSTSSLAKCNAPPGGGKLAAWISRIFGGNRVSCPSPDGSGNGGFFDKLFAKLGSVLGSIFKVAAPRRIMTWVV